MYALNKMDERTTWPLTGIGLYRCPAQGADRIYVTFNNHYKGQSITNARMMQRML